MTAFELHDRITCWLWLYNKANTRSSGLPLVRIFRDGYHFHWQMEMLLDVASLNTPDEIKGTEVEEDVRLAIQLARMRDCELIAPIAALLLKVNSALGRLKPSDFITAN